MGEFGLAFETVAQLIKEVELHTNAYYDYYISLAKVWLSSRVLFYLVDHLLSGGASSHYSSHIAFSGAVN